jgi:hypothetical protein
VLQPDKDGIHTLFLVVALIVIAIKVRNPKMKTRAWIAVLLVFCSMVIWMTQRALAIFLVIIALVALLAALTKKPTPWKRHKGIRRQFSGQVRQVVLNAQKYKCANCSMSKQNNNYRSLVGLARSLYSLFRNIVPLAYPTRFSVH